MRTLALGVTGLKTYREFENQMTGELTLRQVLDLESTWVNTETLIRYLDTSSVEQIQSRIDRIEDVIEPVREFVDTDTELIRFVIGDTMYIVQYEDISSYYLMLIDQIEELNTELRRRGIEE